MKNLTFISLHFEKFNISQEKSELHLVLAWPILTSNTPKKLNIHTGLGSTAHFKKLKINTAAI